MIALSRTGRTSAAALACFVTVLLAAACGGDDENSPPLESAESAVCASIAQLDAAVEKVKNLDSNSSIAEARQALDQVRIAFTAFLGATRNVASVSSMSCTLPVRTFGLGH
jgi:hypothetical protein